MRSIRLLQSRILSVALFFTFISFTADGNHSRIAQTNNVEWLTAERSFYKSGNCNYKVAVTSGKNHFSESVPGLYSNVFLKQEIRLIRTKIKAQCQIVHSIEKLTNAGIPMLLYSDDSDDLHHYFLG